MKTLKEEDDVVFEDLQSNASEKMGESEPEEEEGGDYDDDDDWAWGDGVGKLTRCYASGDCIIK